jgi:hypothetical protein
MKYHISYIKKDKKYNFSITFKDEEHMRDKLLQYRKDSISFEIKELNNNNNNKPLIEKFKPCKEFSQTYYSSRI